MGKESVYDRYPSNAKERKKAIEWSQKVFGPRGKPVIYVGKKMPDEAKQLRQATQKKILFTGLNDAKFKMGDKMGEILRKAVKEHGKENVSLVHGGNERSIIDTNIKRLGKISGINVIEDSLQGTNAKDRKLRRINDPDLQMHSFDSKGNLTAVDKDQAYWGIRDKDIGDSGKAKKSKYRKGKLISKKTTQNYSVNDFLIDEISGTKNLKRQQAGVNYLRSKDEAWIKSQRARGVPEVDIIQGSLTDAQSYDLDLIEQRKKYIPPADTTKGGSKQVGDVRLGKDTNKLKYLYDLSEDSSVPGLDKGHKDLKGLKNTGTLNAPKTGTKTVTKSIKVRGYRGGAQAVLERKYKVREVKKITPQTSSGTEPSSSWSQVERAKEFDTGKDSDRPSIKDKKDFKRSLKREDVNLGKTALSVEGSGADINKSNPSGMDVHTEQHLRKQGVKEKIDLRDIKKFKKVFKKINILENPDPKLSSAERIKSRKQADVHAKTILTSMTDLYDSDAAPERYGGGDPVKGKRPISVTSTKAKAPVPKQERTGQRTLRVTREVKTGPEYNKTFKKSEHKSGRPAIRSVTAPLKALTPFILGGGALQLLQTDAFGERAASNIEGANFQRKQGGGGKRNINPNLRKGIPGEGRNLLTMTPKKKYRKYA